MRLLAYSKKLVLTAVASAHGLVALDPRGAALADEDAPGVELLRPKAPALAWVL